MIEAKSPTASIRRAYNLWSLWYGRLAVPLERRPRMLAVDRLAIQPQDRVLEVAVGPGATLLEVLRRVDRASVVSGVDLSPKMLEKARRLVQSAGYTNVDLREADARQLPFPGAAFDVLFNSYMFDLLPLEDMPIVLGEFRRVLRAGGRLALVNMSKREAAVRTWSERFYTWLPGRLVPYLMGGCRPVLMEDLVRGSGFSEVRREFIDQFIPSEIITATKADA